MLSDLFSDSDMRSEVETDDLSPIENELNTNEGPEKEEEENPFSVDMRSLGVMKLVMVL